MTIDKVSFDELECWLSEAEPEHKTVGKDIMKSEELYAKIKNVTIDEAKVACDELRKKLAAAIPGSTPESIEETLFMKLKLSGGEVQGDKADVLLVAVGPWKDMNFPKKKAALNAYENDPEKALSKNQVRLDENRKPVPIDSTEFFGNPPDPKRKNPNFLKDIGEDLKREAIFVTSTGKCLAGVGKFDGEPGDVAKITGKVSEEKIQVYKNGWKVTDHLDSKALWNEAYTALGNSDIAVPIESIWDSEQYKMVAVMGKVSMATVTRQGAGGAMIAITDIGLDEDVVGFADETDEAMKAAVDNIEKGMEVILFGSVNKYTSKDGVEKKNMNIIGVLINPESSALAAALDKVADIEI